MFSTGMDQAKCFYDEKFYGEFFSGDLLVLLLILHLMYTFIHISKKALLPHCALHLSCGLS